MSNQNDTKRRKLSEGWEEFIEHKGEDGKDWAKCKYCRKLSKEKSNFDLESKALDVARIIIKHQRGISLLDSIKDDILRVYIEEKEKLRESLSKLSCRFSLVIDIVLHVPNDYLFMNICYIDDGWDLRKKVLGFLIEFSEGDHYLEIIKSLVMDWKIDRNMSSFVVVEGYPHVYQCYGEITSQLDGYCGSLPFLGQLYNMKQCFDYVRETPFNGHMFAVAVHIVNWGKKVSNLVSTQFTSDFELLNSAVRRKEAFWKLEQIHPDFKPINLTADEWDEAKAIYDCLKAINNAVKSFSESKFDTANVYFPMFCDIYVKLQKWEKSKYEFVNNIAFDIKALEFDRYWEKCVMALTIAAVFDPRFKMDIVESWYKEIYGDDDTDTHLKTFSDHLEGVYNKYAICFSNCSDSYKMLDRLGRPRTCPSNDENVVSPSSELDQYLKDSRFRSVEEFDILGWWRVNTPNFPTLAMIARDYLAIPFSQAVSYSSFMRTIEIDDDIEYYADSDIQILQAMVLTKSWLESQ
ncbi:hypothetical protein JRO89_XS03G0026200 [Xanthoceras sorbifolium]|uniref:Zinc finger BED domain-containing protein RICESLEEPER 2-like n=1 Tax=Xanthoceras sorbifolium TaxID=99658 RepID=A0ABQ8I8B2_9ROSI|nr:hypothetical protein JRO89_XS03G0026200 [Xanthoceras sorbifolium]